MLFDKRIRNLMDISIWLEVDHNTRWARRVHFKSSDYEQKVLVPMHIKYVQPTKKYAQYVIDVSELSKEEVMNKVEKLIFS